MNHTSSECYFWVLGMVLDPKNNSLARILLTKLMHVLTIFDDLYDAYGTMEELTIFAQATERFFNLFFT